MQLSMANKKRLSVQLNKDEEWVLAKANFLATYVKQVSLRELVLRLVKDEIERNTKEIAKAEQFHADLAKVKK